MIQLIQIIPGFENRSQEVGANMLGAIVLVILLLGSIIFIARAFHSFYYIETMRRDLTLMKEQQEKILGLLAAEKEKRNFLEEDKRIG